MRALWRGAVLVAFVLLAASPLEAQTTKTPISVQASEMHPMTVTMLLVKIQKDFELAIVPDKFNLSILETLRKVGYNVVGGFQLALAACFALTLPIWNQKETPAGSEAPKRLTDYQTPLGETLRQPRTWLSMGLFFVYVGCEVALGIWAYSLLTESRGITPQVAGLVTGSYWATFTVGRIIAGLFAKRVGVDALVQGSLLGAILGALLLWWNPIPAANLAAVALIGFAIAPIFPALMSGTSQRVGVHDAANTIGLQMVATGLGGATISSLMGVLARRTSLEVIPVCLFVLFLVLFGLYRLAMRKS